MIFFNLITFIIAAGFIAVIVLAIVQWSKNNNSPRLEVDAVIVSKRVNVTHQHNAGDPTGAHGFIAHTFYYATFQVASGDRMEFSVGSFEYGQLVEGDRGRLRFQGTRYLGFERYL